MKWFTTRSFTQFPWVTSSGRSDYCTKRSPANVTHLLYDFLSFAFSSSSTYIFSTMALTVFLLGMLYVGFSSATDALNPGSSTTEKGWESFTIKSTTASSSSCFLDPENTKKENDKEK
ncbi:hypothetical protein CHARACLAT_028165 [Characodon lateralis]|uniref:Transmembrane protein n=1 Tax=Characodon lateralis TaxID=208331 RepID=A0ABU7CVA5_9TELE|nr:hypothetical protein [Characodon lateralis]